MYFRPTRNTSCQPSMIKGFVTKAVVVPNFKFLASKPTRCKGSRVPGTGNYIFV